MVLARLFRRTPFEREGFLLYGAAVAAAREPLFYLDYGAPDTMAGRFDLVCLHVALLIRRIRLDPDPAARDLAQAVFDAMFHDMDVNLREMGVGDLAVGPRVRKLWEAFHGRARAYEAALEEPGPEGLAAALLRNLYAGRAPADPRVLPALAAHARALAAVLAEQDMAALRRGEVRFAPPPPLAPLAEESQP
ncbi:MAG: ubiquinol-cytochrome C chaperone family protein [Rhodovarius sp.]|nr:ubiquinol-cytochrome C chaperone family protein [Rhodovarius sp.]